MPMALFSHRITSFRTLDDVTLAQVSLSYLLMVGGDPGSALITDGAGNPHYALNFVV